MHKDIICRGPFISNIKRILMGVYSPWTYIKTCRISPYFTSVDNGWKYQDHHPKPRNIRMIHRSDPWVSISVRYNWTRYGKLLSILVHSPGNKATVGSRDKYMDILCHAVACLYACFVNLGIEVKSWNCAVNDIDNIEIDYWLQCLWKYAQNCPSIYES